MDSFKLDNTFVNLERKQFQSDSFSQTVSVKRFQAIKGDF